VDVVGVDGYNWGTTNGGWRSIERIISGKYNWFYNTLGSSRPFAVGETGSREAGGNKAAWVAQAKDQLAQNFPRLTHVTIFDDNFSGYRDWRVNSTQAALDAYKAWFADSRYQQALT
jgi:hypothetical protein